MKAKRSNSQAHGLILLAWPMQALRRLGQARPGVASLILVVALIIQSVAIAAYVSALYDVYSTLSKIGLGIGYGIALVPCMYIIYIQLECWILRIKPSTKPTYFLNFSLFALAIALISIFRVSFGFGMLGEAMSTVFAYDSGWALFPARFPLLDLPAMLLIVGLRAGCLIYAHQFKPAAYLTGRDKQSVFVLLLLWWLSLYLYTMFVHQGDFTPFTNRSTLDFTAYKSISNGLVMLRPGKGFFMIGYPLIISPFNLILGTFTPNGGMEALNELNWALLLVIPFGLMGAAIILLSRGVAGAADAQSHTPILFVGIVTIAALYLYGMLYPPYAGAGDRLAIKDITIGFIGGVEPINTLLAAVAVYVLSRPTMYSAWIGVIGGLAVMSKETNVLIFGLFVLFWFLSPGGKWPALKTGVVSLAVFSIQVIYNFAVFGGGLLPHRAYQAQLIGPMHSRFFERTWGITSPNPPAVSIDYAIVNLPQILEFYWLIFVVILLSYVALMAKKRERWQLWTFAFLTILVFLVFYSGFSRLGATFRYLHLMAPLGAVLLAPVLWLLYQKVLQFLGRTGISRP